MAEIGITWNKGSALVLAARQSMLLWRMTLKGGLAAIPPPFIMIGEIPANE